MKGSYSSVERSSAISEHLNIVEVKFHAIDKTVHKVLKFLCTLNIRKLNIDTLSALYCEISFHMWERKQGMN
jgi:hypothetical protein